MEGVDADVISPASADTVYRKQARISGSLLCSSEDSQSKAYFRLIRALT